jgi:hypothetical protein
MADKLKVRVVRPLMYEGRVVAEGVILTLPAGDALDACDTGRAVLLDSADLPLAVRARREEVIRQTRQFGRPMADPGSPWQRVN